MHDFQVETALCFLVWYPLVVSQVSEVFCFVQFQVPLGSIWQARHCRIDVVQYLSSHMEALTQMVAMIRLTAKNWVQRFIKCWHLVITLMFLISYYSNLQESSCGPERCWMWCQCLSWRTTRCALPVKMERSFGQESWTCMTNYENW